MIIIDFKIDKEYNRWNKKKYFVIQWKSEKETHRKYYNLYTGSEFKFINEMVKIVNLWSFILVHRSVVQVIEVLVVS